MSGTKRTFGRRLDTGRPTPASAPVIALPGNANPPMPIPTVGMPSDPGVDSARSRTLMRERLFQEVLDVVPLKELYGMDPEQARTELGDVSRTLIGRGTAYNVDMVEAESLIQEIINDILGLGPLESLIQRDDIADIMVCGPNKIFIEVKGRLELTPIRFRTEEQLRNVASRIVQAVGRRVDESSPICDARLKDGSRVAIVIPPIALDGTCITIRKFRKDKLQLSDLVKYGSISPHGAKLLEIISACRLNVLVSGGTGSGKAQPYDSMLRTPTGWKQMGDAKLGDILLAPDGALMSITGVFPQGEKDIFRLTFEDGRTAECCDDHLWKVWTRMLVWNSSKKCQEYVMGWRIVPLSEMKEWFERKSSMWAETAVPLVSPMAMEFPSNTLPIEPYALAALVKASPQHCPEHIGDVRGLEAFELPQAMNTGHQLNGLRASLEEMGLWNKEAHEKFIPLAYKNGSIAQRVALIKGFMDTDSFADELGSTITTTSKQLAEDIQEICWSLGAIASITEMTSDMEHVSYHLHIRHLSLEHPTGYTKREAPLKLGVKSIEYVGRKHAQCIAVDHPDHLYTTNGYVVTHNTTLLNVLTRFIDPDESIITCEDAAELQLQQPNVRRWETRPANLEGKGEIAMAALVKASLRHRPERIIIGEVRGPEAFDLLQAMNTGHDGSAGTVHSNSPREAVSRLESLIAMGGFNLPAKQVREQIANSIDVVIQASRLRDGSRKITSITEITGMEGDTPLLQELMKIEYTETKDGRLETRHVMTGVRPKFWDKARYYGMEKELLEVIEGKKR